MLKALELIGFKSFAEKTRFEFPPGITVVVGPNGSGKSNIVDAIKWVLGEQSVKSLRGKEMADVIFNGSGSRRPMNTAEITLTFDNSKKLFAIDTPDVQITRRVYRSGEGEYLINRQPSRLRDIRDLLAGTGLGTQAYSVIEQGKVDVLLQASSRDRRVIFEEAAGISRFKAKKIEALRRLERVQQNLLRLSDIVDEVDGRLRTVRLQAGKARRYKEYSDRLQELRTQVALVDWTRLSQRLAVFEEDLAALEDQRSAAVAEAEALEARLLEADTQISDINEAVRAGEVQNAGNRERIAAGESTIEHERGRCRDLEEEIARHQRQLAAMSVRAGDFRQQLQETAEALTAAESHHRQIARSLAEGERAMTDLMTLLDQVRGEEQQDRGGYVERVRAVAVLQSEIGGLEAQMAAASAAQEQGRRRASELDQQLGLVCAELDELRQQREELTRQLDSRARDLAAAGGLLEQSRQQHAARQSELAQLRQRHSGAAERIAVLEELQNRCEGLSAGVKEVLSQARAAQQGPFRQVCGLVADLLHVSVEGAPLVEVALGETAQYVVVTPGEELVEYLKSQSYRFAGRVGFIWLDGHDVSAADAPGPESGHGPDLTGRPGVLARADRFVQTEPRYAPLARRLLGRTWIVEKLGHALTLAQSAGRGQHFVTLAGELLAADGTLAVGPRHVSIGLISRRSELRTLHQQLKDLEGKIAQAGSALSELEEQVAAREREVRTKTAEHQQDIESLGQHGHKIATAEERRSQLDQQRTAVAAQQETAARQCEAVGRELAAAAVRQEESQAALGGIEARLAALTTRIEGLEAQRQARARQTTEIKVELAKSEERLANLHGRMRQVEESQQERHRAIAETREQMSQCAARAQRAQWDILERESEIAELYLKKESLAGRIVELIDQREELHAQRSELTAAAQRCRTKARKLEEKSHAKQLEAGDVRHERSSLADRIREDYGIELGALEHEPTAEEQHQREQVQEEIDDLRRKINNLGNVNLEALEELQQLDERHGALAAQYKDLADAKASLERIIDRINTDSRQLFSETLETVRGHFQNLFRDLFGGGRADIILEEGVDILESGVEIVARPPGKEPRSISLLSGGEKTMTCVALLLAIFRSRPSPFCVLDEVDAALDEANIDRFTKVLHDFLAWTQFVIVTHSKKTMTCANTIYGVTMQESGVSKQVSVRFEDVSDDGQIRPGVAAATEGPAPAEGDETQAA
jgi:chromosome segregation protein